MIRLLLRLIERNNMSHRQLMSYQLYKPANMTKPANLNLHNKFFSQVFTVSVYFNYSSDDCFVQKTLVPGV